MGIESGFHNVIYIGESARVGQEGGDGDLVSGVEYAGGGTSCHPRLTREAKAPERLGSGAANCSDPSSVKSRGLAGAGQRDG